MQLIEQLKKEIYKLTKKRKYKHVHINLNELYNNLYYYDSGDDYTNSYIRKGKFYGYVKRNKKYNKQRIVKPLNFGSSKYKLEIVLEMSFAICIDHKKIKIFSDIQGSIPVYESYTIDKDTYFNLSLTCPTLLTADEIDQIRKIMIKHAKNKSLSIYKSPIISASLIPNKW